ncbi:hypothetical protein KC19_3G040300 [Ceratodon purpureus]|uniref:Secreted protein n=1 Tax=Ceratodon purpureus TaxID=3225 RepID=A0A8T0IGZ8_CERPU|nr:hypothetical protein KC19_3G040300 [Ceratodon purpureus]
MLFLLFLLLLLRPLLVRVIGAGDVEWSRVERRLELGFGVWRSGGEIWRLLEVVVMLMWRLVVRVVEGESGGCNAVAEVIGGIVWS